jgi:hypothetical protein
VASIFIDPCHLKRWAIPLTSLLGCAYAIFHPRQRRKILHAIELMITQVLYNKKNTSINMHLSMLFIIFKNN